MSRRRTLRADRRPLGESQPGIRIGSHEVAVMWRTPFEIADVRVSTKASRKGPSFRAGRYEVQCATMLRLITTAYNLDADKVEGGPNWLDFDKFDIVAKVPPPILSPRRSG